MGAIAASAGAMPRATTTSSKWLVAVAVGIGALLEIIDTSIVNVALTDIQTSVGASLSQASWVVSSYGVANVIVLPMTAWLGDRFGKKRYFIFSLIGFTLASILCGLASSLPMLIVARVLQGLMGGGLLAKAQAFLLETFSKEEQPMAQALFGAIVIAGPTIGPTLGGYIVTHYDWRWIFYVNVPIGIGAVLLCLHALPADSRRRTFASVDWSAIVLLAVGLGSLQTVLEEGNAEDWFESKLILTLTIASVVGLVAFVDRELRVSAPIVDLRVLRHRSLWAGSLLSVAVGMALYGTLFSVPIFAQSIMGYDAMQTGMLLLPGALVSAFTMPFVGRVARRVSDPRIVLAAGACVLICGLMLLTNLSPQTGGEDLFWPLVVRAFGTVMMFLPLSLATLGSIPRAEIASAAAFFSLTRQLGGSIGVALLTTLLSQRQAFHRAVLVEHVAVGDAAAVERVGALTQGFLAKGMSAAEAHQSALKLLDGVVDQQSAVLSFADTFWATGVLVLLCVPLMLLLRRPAKDREVALAH